MENTDNNRIEAAEESQLEDVQQALKAGANLNAKNKVRVCNSCRRLKFITLSIIHCCCYVFPVPLSCSTGPLTCAVSHMMDGRL